ncbi:MAG TPA: trigger factor [Leucothrix mucor]|nr:trigger factor [Leucothrix mucor]
MQVSVESTGNIGRKMNVSVPAERIDGEVEKRLKDMRGRVKIDGFRPGKVPLSVVSQQYGDSVYQEVVGEIFQSTFYEAATAESLRVAGMPNIDAEVLEAGKDLEYVATFEVYPTFEIANVEELEISRAAVKIMATDVNKMIETLREQQKEWKDVKRAAKEGDIVVVDFEGTIDGEEFEGGSAKDFTVELGSGRMLKDFDDGLAGMKVGGKKTIDVTFPADYPAENLKDKTAQFELSVTAVRSSSLPKVDEDFIKKFGVEDGTKKSFKEEIKANMERELEQNIKARLKQSVMDGLHDLHDIEVPASLVTEEIKHVRNEMSGNTGTDVSTLPDELFTEQASRRVKLGLIVGEIITSNDMKKDQKKVDDMLESMASTYEDPQALIEYYKTNEQAMQTVEAAVMEEMIVDWVINKASVNDEEMSFSDLMSPEDQAAAA